MSPENDHLLTQLTVRIDDINTARPIGSGILFSNPILNDSIYLLTAAHCLYEDAEKFEQPRQEISISLFSPSLKSYESLTVTINHKLVSKSPTKDVAIIVINKREVEVITGILPIVEALKERQSIVSFALKGFPNATQGREIVLTRPEFVQTQPGKTEFQLRLIDDFSTETSAESKVDGFSGSGVFLENHNRLYLFGIFTRFRESQKIIYCQYIEVVNEFLQAAYLPSIPFAYIGSYGLTKEFFARHNENSISNLGPRFSERLNFKQPIAFNFNDIAKDEVFKSRLLECLDKFLLYRNYSDYSETEGVLKELVEKLKSLKNSVISWVKSMRWEADQQVELTQLANGLRELKSSIETKRQELHKLQRQELQKKKEDGKNKEDEVGYNKMPYDSELYWLNNTERSIYALSTSLGEISIRLANSPFLIIQGEAGCGKSHLLGDIANEATKSGVARLLFLGQLFHRGQSIWQNIITQLGLNCTKEELLISLNDIGRQQGIRLLIMIDALNEGPGQELWKDALPGFIEDVRRHPFVGLVMTLRSTYFNAILKENIQTDDRITFINHEGFKGNEYAALRLFCEYYELQTPNFPMLAPEFTNPLFLQLICQGIQMSGERIFPQGFQGLTQIFNFYREGISKKLAEKREDYFNKKHVVKNAISEFAKACFEKSKIRMLTIDEADRLFEEKFPRFPNLLNDLVHENVFIQTTQTDYSSQEESEMVYFAYERFGDFYMTERLLGKYSSVDDVKIAFQQNGQLGYLLEGRFWRNNGILEAMAVRLPELFNLEIVEVFDWAFQLAKKSMYRDIDERLSRFLWDSLKWRQPSNVNDDKITSIIRGGLFKIDQTQYLLRLLELTTVHDHPFNSDRLFRFLHSFTMGKRDSFWQKFMRGYGGMDDYENAFPIRRLIDWAWQKEVFKAVDEETARLAGQTLAWLLSSTERQLRDQATKAMVNLLQEQPNA